MWMPVVVLWTFIIFLLIAIVLIRIFQGPIIGRLGEKYTAKNVQSISGGIVFHDIYVPGSHGVQQMTLLRFRPME